MQGSANALLLANIDTLANIRSDQDTWNQGDLLHLIPTASHNRFLIKCSFNNPQSEPLLRVDGRLIQADNSDSFSRYFAFDVPLLSSNTEYTLQLFDKKAKALCDPWPLSTFPSPSSEAKTLRVLTYTCAGGYPYYDVMSEQPFLSIAQRKKLLRRAMSFRPDVLIANGDHIYWDQRSQMESENPKASERARTWYNRFGQLDMTVSPSHPKNEAIIKRAVEPQISHIYGVSLRSTPSFFVGDDHDYFEGDKATTNFVTFPPSDDHLAFSRFTRNLFLPDFLPTKMQPGNLPGSGAPDRPTGISESFGTLRFGNLLEVLMYDCARHISLNASNAGLIPKDAEQWVCDRTQDEYVQQLIHIPSHPFGYSAGKWREWYPDVLESREQENMNESPKGDAYPASKLTTSTEKYLWQTGWLNQHQRIIEKLHEQNSRPGIIVSGDLHATGHAVITKSYGLDLKANPVHSILSGPIGTGTGWPSAARGTQPKPPMGIELTELAEIREKNGFAIIDVFKEQLEISLFQWRKNQNEKEIDSLEPYHRYTIARKGKH